MKKIVIGIILLIIICFGFWFYQSKNGGSKIVSDFKNATYIIENKDVALKNGYSEEEIISGSASKIVTRYFGNEAGGDFNNDGNEDIAFLLTQDAGGSGTFFYVVAALKTDSGYKGTNAILLGDRIAPQTTEFRDREIIVNYAERKSNESMAIPPSVGVSRYFKVINSKLAEIQRGLIIWGEGVREFQACGIKDKLLEAQWIVGNSPAYEDIRKTYEEKMAGTKPYSPLYVEIVGNNMPKVKDGFGADYERAILIDKLISVSISDICK